VRHAADGDLGDHLEGGVGLRFHDPDLIGGLRRDEDADLVVEADLRRRSRLWRDNDGVGEAEGVTDATGASDGAGSTNRALTQEASNIVLTARIPKSLNFPPNARRVMSSSKTARRKRSE
jgi:hypothetical protein